MPMKHIHNGVEYDENDPELQKILEKWEQDMREMEERAKAAEAERERTRQLNAEELFDLIMPYLIPDLNVCNLIIPASKAARLVDRYPEWETGKTYALLYRVQHNGKLWRCKLANLSRASNEPSEGSAYWRLLTVDSEDE